MVFYQQVRFMLSGCAVPLGAANVSLDAVPICKLLDKRESVVPNQKVHRSVLKTHKRRYDEVRGTWVSYKRLHNTQAGRVEALVSSAELSETRHAVWPFMVWPPSLPFDFISTSTSSASPELQI